MSVSDRYADAIEMDTPPYDDPLLMTDALREEIGKEAWPMLPQNPLFGENLYTNPYTSEVELGMRVAARNRRDREAGAEVAWEIWRRRECAGERRRRAGRRAIFVESLR